MTSNTKLRATSSVFFVAGLAGAAALAMALDRTPRGVWELGREFSDEQAAPLTGNAQLSQQALHNAKIAWAYILNNTDPKTGLVNSVDGFPSTTLWDQGSYLLGLVAAHRLDLISREELDQRARSALASLELIELFDGKLPNKVYDTSTLAMVDYSNEEVAGGVGWSALDIARLLMGFEALRRLDPALAEPVSRVVARWSLTSMVENGMLMGARVGDDGPERVQEGRIGYEQYAARSAAMFGLDTLGVARATPVLNWSRVSGVKVGTDMRGFSDYGAITPVVSEPYMLMALEIGLDGEAQVLSHRVYQAQSNRFDRTGLVTAVSEDHLDQAPHFVYSSVSGNGVDWAVLDEHGNFHDSMRTLSSKAAISWNAIYGGDYGATLMGAVADLGVVGQGWYAGIYETGGAVNKALTLNTNAVILEALHYQVFGPILVSR